MLQSGEKHPHGRELRQQNCCPLKPEWHIVVFQRCPRTVPHLTCSFAKWTYHFSLTSGVHFFMYSFWKIYVFIYLKRQSHTYTHRETERERDKRGERKRQKKLKSADLLVHCLYSCNSWIWVRLKPEAGASSGFSLYVAGVQIFGLSLLISKAISRELD